MKRRSMKGMKIKLLELAGREDLELNIHRLRKIFNLLVFLGKIPSSQQGANTSDRFLLMSGLRPA